jgi:CRP-like cAMP-binding protein
MSDLTNLPNHVLASLSPQDSDLLRPHLRHQQLTLRSVLYRPEEPIHQVYFPTDGVISLVVGLSDGFMVEAGMFGKNSVVGGGAALDGRVAVNQAIVQASGSSLIVDTEVLSKCVSESDTLRKALMAHELASYALTQQTAACNARHGLEERLCRWLMQTRDLLESDTLPLTQEFLAQMQRDAHRQEAAGIRPD